MPQKHSVIIRGWFAFNILFSLAPAVYWFANRLQTAIWGLPPTLCYFLLVSLSITASIVYAYVTQARHGALES